MGQRIAEYEVLAPIRSGGMAALYLARRRGVGGFSRLVALKLIHPHLLQDPSIIDLFLDEARIAAGIRHPNVVHVEEVGVHEGSYFIAMEYVHGVSLSQFVERLEEKRLRLNPRLASWIIAQIAEALHAAHEAAAENGTPLNIVHRDVSPQNVLIGHTGHVKLIDFGIAKSRISSRVTEKGNSVLGKLRYMSPEQLRLEPVGRRSDLYALGVMLWEMLTSREFLRCNRVDDPRDWETREHPPAPSRYMPGVRSGLDRVTLRALAFEPSERFATAFELRRALLRAEPSASLVDAPRVASLLRALLGEELDRRMLDWPSAVTRELDLDVSSSHPLAMEELTVEVDYASLGLELGDYDSTQKGGGLGLHGPAESWASDTAFGLGTQDFSASEDELTVVKLPGALVREATVVELGRSDPVRQRVPRYSGDEELTTVLAEGSSTNRRISQRYSTLQNAGAAVQRSARGSFFARLHGLYRALPVTAITHTVALGLSCLVAGTLVGVLAVGSEEPPTRRLPRRLSSPAAVRSPPTVRQLRTVGASPKPLPPAHAVAAAVRSPEPVSRPPAEHEVADAGVNEIGAELQKVGRPALPRRVPAGTKLSLPPF